MNEAPHSTIAVVCKNAVRIGGLLAIVMVLSCGVKKEPPLTKEQALGTFYLNTVGSWTEGEFRLSSAATNSSLGFAIQGLAHENPGVHVAQWKHVINELAGGKLRLKLQLFLKNSSNDFYCAEFPLGLAGAGAKYGTDRQGANYVFSGDSDFNELGRDGFSVHGAAATPAVPTLVGLLDAHDPQTRSDSAEALGAVGPPLRVVFPP